MISKRGFWVSAMFAMSIGVGCGVALAQGGGAADTTHWVATWASAQQVPRGSVVRPPVVPASAGATVSPTPAPAAATPAAPPVMRPARGFNNQTVRMVVRASMGGSRVRVHLSNAYGTTALMVGAAHVARRGTDSAIVEGTDRPLLFNGKGAVTIPPGAEMISDEVALEVPKLGELAVSVFIPGDSGPASVHALGLHTTWVSKEGDFTSAPEIADADKTQSWYWVSEVDVAAPASAATIVAYGDSITDGATSTADTDRSWPSILAQRLTANAATANVAIVNQGISGNRVLSDGAGVSALARFDRDVLAVAGVKWLMILEGINDITGTMRPVAGVTPITADDLIGAMKQMILMAHDHGIKVIGCTLTPFGGKGTAEVDAMREGLNTFIRSSGMFDKVVDFEAVTRDPNDLRQFQKAYNNSDRLHPNDAGYKAMADSIDLSMFVEAASTGRSRR